MKENANLSRFLPYVLVAAFYFKFSQRRMEMLASLQFKMRVTPTDRKMIAAVAKHFHLKDSKAVKILVRAMYQVITKQAHQEGRLPRGDE